MDTSVQLVLVGFFAVAVGVGTVRRGKILGAEMDLKRSKRGGILIPLGVVAFLVGVGLAGFGGLSKLGIVNNSSTTPGVTSNPSLPLSPTASTEAKFYVTLKLPVDLTKAMGAGTPISGMVHGDPGSYTLWLFIRSGGVWYLSQQIDAQADQVFDVNSGPFGGVQDAGKWFTVGVFSANLEQTKIIKDAPRNAHGDVTFDDSPGKLMISRQVMRS